ncbi:helix-turn-helix domain-containing protein [Qingshengfaniella alkalisoli]|uniref:DUF4115 domain-containing protein n=1 Tax=Qingshengfaniella alkalisoli TaxID=2599296 RepID=A0A5B8J3J7_9RHOB|nr:helix-turn-helix domain-containing protein [Qingshengfaniella alkalisoli]QDY68870.1 DUF4115 domain-containing protein [Qingshengfaniella alkalisoli]
MMRRADTPDIPDSGPKSFDDYDLKLGDIMRGERATLGKSLLDVQREIKIKASYIAAIENADLAAFETPGFIAGYVRSYARYLKMNPDWVYKAFCEESGFSHVTGLDAKIHAKPQNTKSVAQVGRSHGAAKAPAKPFSDEMLARSPIQATPRKLFLGGIEPGAVGSIVVLTGLIAALGYGGWSVLQQIQRVTVAPIETQITALPTETGDVEERPSESVVAENTPPRAEALERLYRPQVLERPVVVPRDGPIATLDPAAQGVYAGYRPPPQIGSVPELKTAAATRPDRPVIMSADHMALAEMTRAEEAVDTGEVQVVEEPAPGIVMFAVRPAWVRVRAADGTVLLEKILETGERYVLPDTAQPPTLRAGNSGSVYFAVNGQTLGPAGPGTSVAKNVVLSADALGQSYQLADLSENPELARVAELAIASQEPPLEQSTEIAQD